MWIVLIIVVLCMPTLSLSDLFRQASFEEADMPYDKWLHPTSPLVFDEGASLCVPDGGFTWFAGSHGALTDGDCGALYYFTVMAYIDAFKKGQKEFRYIETGSFAGLSAHIVAVALVRLNASAIVYAHDLFDEQMPDGNSHDAEYLWEYSASEEKTRLQIFYANVLRNGLHGLIIPIAGPSRRTLRIHPPESAQLIFVDGDHSYEGAIWDMRLAWKALVPGGFMLVHDCFPPGHELAPVRDAVKTFSEEINVPWAMFNQTMFMAVMQKPDATPVEAEISGGAESG